jgi:hypothetical protein
MCRCIYSGGIISFDDKSLVYRNQELSNRRFGAKRKARPSMITKCETIVDLSKICAYGLFKKIQKTTTFWLRTFSNSNILRFPQSIKIPKRRIHGQSLELSKKYRVKRQK